MKTLFAWNRESEHSVAHPALRRELLAMFEEDQKARFAFVKRADRRLADAFHAIDRKNTARMKQIVGAYGWPGKRLVGDEGANAAWLLVQHADADIDFQKRCLVLLAMAVAARDADVQNYESLHDRVAKK